MNMIVKLPCGVGSVLRNIGNKREYVIAQYEIKGIHNLVCAICSESKTGQEIVILRCRDGKLPDNFEIVECCNFVELNLANRNQL